MAKMQEILNSKLLVMWTVIVMVEPDQWTRRKLLDLAQTTTSNFFAHFYICNHDGRRCVALELVQLEEVGGGGLGHT